MYGDSPALSSDSGPIFPSNLKPAEPVFPNSSRGQELPFMDSDTSSNYREYRQQYANNNNNNHHGNSGLLRFRSAPSSFFGIFTNEIDKSGNINTSAAQGLIAKFNSGGENSLRNWEDTENKAAGIGLSGLSSQLPPQYPRQSIPAAAYQGQARMSSNLMRQNSSPVGLFSNLTSQNGYATMRGVGSYRMVDSTTTGELSPSGRARGQMNYSSGMPSSLGMLSQITEVENENGAAIGLDDAKVANTSDNNLYYTSYRPQLCSWNNSSDFAESFPGIKREISGDEELFADIQNREISSRQRALPHQLSLPNTSSEMATMQKLLSLQDTVPFKIRAKRGCATHPRSIAERVRRTKISERMRKLQELVPNMDRQTNTADMLDFAVDYIKSLQKQYKILSDNRANCKCSAIQKSITHQTQ